MHSKHSAEIDLRALCRVVAFGRPSRALFLAILSAMAFVALLNTYLPILTGRVINALQEGTVPWRPLGAYAAISIVAAIVSGASAYLSTKLREDYTRTLRERLVECVHRARYSALARMTFGELSNRMTTDTAGMSAQAQMTVFPLLRDSLTLVATLVAVFALDVRFGVISIVLLLLSSIPTISVIRPFARLGLAQASAYDRLYGALHETCTLQAAVLVRNANASERESKRMGSLAAEVARLNMRQSLIAAFSNVASTGIRLLGPLVVLGYGSFLAAHHQMSAGSVVALLMYQMRMYDPFLSLSSAQTKLVGITVTSRRLKEIIDLEPEPTDGPIYESSPSLRLNDVSLSYGEKPVLSRLSLELLPGRHTALLGPSGAGKSTIGMLLLRIFDADAGSITAGGSDISRIDLRSLRSNLVVVPQDALVFDADVRENVAYFRPDASDADVRAVLEVCRLAAVVEQLESGLDTILGQRGFRLSGGERQRLCVARALLAQPDVLVLDEALSGVDPENERAILADIRSMMRNRTLIVITHRLASVRDFDQIAIIEDGSCTAHATKEEASLESPWYRANTLIDTVTR